MASSASSLFTRFDIREDEQILAYTFSFLQLCHLQNELAIAAEAKTLLAYDPLATKGDERFVRENEYLRGKIEALQGLIKTHEMFQDDLKEAVDAMAANREEQKEFKVGEVFTHTEAEEDAAKIEAKKP